MGAELGQFTEWNFNKDIDWILLDHEMHQKINLFYKELNHFYKEHSELWADDLSWNGYQWIQPDDGDSSILAFRRIDPKKGKELICVLSFTPVCRDDYRLGLPKEGTYEPVFCSDDWRYGGTNQLPHEVKSEPIGYREYEHSGLFRIPPMSVTFYARKPERKGRKKAEQTEE